MSEDSNDAVDAADGDDGLSTREYLEFVFLNRLSLAGLALAAAGGGLVVLLGPDAGGTRNVPLVGGTLLLLGMFLFALGYTRGQHRIRDRGW